MYLTHRESSTQVAAVIEEVEKGDYKRIKQSKRFTFDWELEKDSQVFKISLVESKEIVGLMALKDVPNELRIEIHLLEASEENVGEDKVYDRIAGCLIAYACREAFVRGYFGYVSLIPKTELEEHYKNAYGMENEGKHVYTDLENSKDLIKFYLED